MKKIFIVLVTLLLTLSNFAQKKELKKALKAYDKRNFVEAVEYFELATQKKGKFENAAKEKFAISYYRLNNYTTALETFYDVEMSELSDLGSMFFGILLQRNGSYERAINMFNQSLEKGLKDPRIHLYIKACEWAGEQSGEDNFSVSASNLRINSKSFGVQYYNNGIVYTRRSDAHTKDYLNRHHVDLYYSELIEGGLGATEPFSKEINSKGHDGGITFSYDYKTMYYTQFIEDDGDMKYKIFSSKYDGKEWKMQQEMFFNSSKFSCAFPALSQDATELYFASDMPGGLGGMDLYVIRKNGQRWGKPENLGSKINSPGNEIFPFISSTGVMYFASDGHPGYGGYDIFSASGQGTEWDEVTCMKPPVNSPKDDFAFIIDPMSDQTGFLSSNRETDGTYDKVYNVKREETSSDDDLSDFLESSSTTDDDSGIPESESEEDLSDFLETAEPEETSTAPDGQFEINENPYEETESESEGIDLSDFLEESDSDQTQPDTSTGDDGSQNLTLSEQLKQLHGPDALIYRVQFKSSKEKLDQLQMIETGDFVFRYFYKGLWRYTVGEFYDVDPAIELKEKVKALGYSDAFIAAFRGDQRVLDVVIYK